MNKLQKPELDSLFEAILKLETVEECSSFFEDICTIKELQDMAQRLEVAKMLHKSRSYAEISRETGASTATISRVNKCLVYGSDGYRSVLAKLSED